MFDVIPVTCPRDTVCGPTSLKMLLAWYGIEVELAELIEACNVGVGGCTLKDVLNAGRAYGLDAVSYHMDAEELMRQDRPAIIWWKYNHFCVFAGINDAWDVVICNPSRGRYALTPGTFKSLYSHIAMFNGEPHDLPEVSA